MPATSLTFGMNAVTSGYVESYEVSKKMTEKVIVSHDGTFAQGHCFDPVFDISIRGRGDSPSAAVADSSISGFTAPSGSAALCVTSVRTSERADDFASWDITAQAFSTGATRVT